MSYKRLGFLISLSLIAGLCVYQLSMREGGDLEQFRDLRKAQQQKQSSSVGSVRPQPSSDMVVSKIPHENYWFVGKFEDGGGVEIPFQPGSFPEKSSELVPREENPGFVGPEQCAECHRETYNTFVQTGHYKTSRVVSPDTIDGSFESDSNKFQTSEPNLHFEMIRRGDSFLQCVHFFDWSFEVPMEIIMGSSKMAQTYLYWHKDALYQDNVTHITKGNQWINSPGYIDGDAAYARPIPQRCLECHMTYFDYRGGPNHYTPESLIMGVTCERCHGPGKDHVTYHQANPKASGTVSITHPGKLPRKLQMDICGQCHGGSRGLKHDALSFRPGDPLEDHYHDPDDEADAKNSVHTSNQLNRLSESTCFQKSEMTCITCHDPHHNERANKSLFSKRCMTCHVREEDCAFFPKKNVNFADNCVDCHMPQRATDNLKLNSIEGDVFPPLRDHLIRVDQEATKAHLAK